MCIPTKFGVAFWQLLTCQASGLSPEVSWGAVAAPCFQTKVLASCWLAVQRIWCFLTTPHQTRKASQHRVCAGPCWDLGKQTWRSAVARLQAGKETWSPTQGSEKSLFSLDTVLRVTAPEKSNDQCTACLVWGCKDQPALCREWEHWTRASQSTAADGESEGHLKQVWAGERSVEERGKCFHKEKRALGE